MKLDIYTLTILFTVGIAGGIAYNTMKKEDESGNSHLYLFQNKLGTLISTALLLSILIYTFMNYVWWYPVALAIVSLIFANILHHLLLLILGIVYSRMIQIWVLPVISLIYFIYKIF